MTAFSPIAIIGQACVLPGALSPAELWDLVRTRRCAIGPVPAGRWRLNPQAVLAAPAERRRESAWSDQGGYVRDFEGVFDPSGFGLTPAEILSLDAPFQWVLHVAREALRTVKRREDISSSRQGLILGLLSYPGAALSQYAEATWLESAGLSLPGLPLSSGTARLNPLNRFFSGQTAVQAARAMGMSGEAFSLDAACASSLYAIKLACDALHDQRLDLVLAGGVSGADDLFIHMGFSALNALSPSGRSLPFNREADGLVPAEGAALVALKRLPDAVSAGDHILAVIRGIGLSNDGRSGGFLSPSATGQSRAIRQAYSQAGLQPRNISLLECHATGTLLGDGVELEALRDVFAGVDDLPLGSLKSNVGHLITAAGAAALLKVIAAMNHGVRPPTIGSTPLRDEVLRNDASRRALRVLEAEEDWPRNHGPRRAGISAFGFGGTNSHLILEEWLPGASDASRAAPRRRDPIASAAATEEPTVSHETPGFSEKSTYLGDSATNTAGDSEADFGRLAIVGPSVQAADRAGLAEFEAALFDDMVAAVADDTNPKRQRGSQLITSLALRVSMEGDIFDRGEYSTASGETGRMERIVLDARDLRFPPRDLQQALPQQILALKLAMAAISAVALRHDTTGVFVGMQADAEVARSGARWRIAEWAQVWRADFPVTASPDWLAAARLAFVPPLEAATVVGTMPNISANRINVQLDLQGPSFTLSADELSGIRALETAARALRAGELDAAIVCAVDLCCEPVHAAAAKAVLFENRQTPGDAGVAIVLKRLADARRDGDTILALLEPPIVGEPESHDIPTAAQNDAFPTNPKRQRVNESTASLALRVSDIGDRDRNIDAKDGRHEHDAVQEMHFDETHAGLTPSFGHAHAASGLLHVAAAVLALRRKSWPACLGSPQREWSVGQSPLRVAVHVAALGGQTACVELTETVGERVPAAPAVSVSNPGIDLSHQKDVFRKGLARGHAPLLEFAAHFPPVRLPSLVSTRVASQSVESHFSATLGKRIAIDETRGDQFSSNRCPPPARLGLVEPQVMAPAPALPSMLNALEMEAGLIAVSSHDAPERPRNAGERSHGAVVNGINASGKNSNGAAALLSLIGHLGAAHQEYLSLQQQVHETFLKTRGMPGRHVPPVESLAASNSGLIQPALNSSPNTRTDAKPHVVERNAPSKPTAKATTPVEPRAVLALLADKGPCGPSFSRQELEILAGGRVSSVFGPLFERQDDYRRQVRLPEPPLLLVDRVTGLDAEPGVEATGTIWTETDVTWDSWYLHDGVMPAGIVVESGQADLLLISWMGADFKNRNDRVYRLLGCELTFFGGLPRPGDTLCYRIDIDGHARQGDVRLFFFHYECRINGELRLRVRDGQAGFFSDEELAGSDGVLWNPETAEHAAEGAVELLDRMTTGRAFSRDQVMAFYEGRTRDCFGPEFAQSAAHVRTPRIAGPRLQMIHEVTEFAPHGGPWKRGYLRARTTVDPGDWFFAGHFKNDPCMPGTLMCEACLQTMAFYLTAAGYAQERDGWRFEPVTNESYKMRCRGQVLPTSQELVYELFVEELTGGATPTLYADLLCTVDGVKAFHCRRMGLQLVPDWPLNSRPDLLARREEPRPTAQVDDVRGDYRALIACAWGRPSEAFGEMYRVFDGPRGAPRLPGPPYHFMSRLTRIDAPRGVVRLGSSVECEYYVPPAAWYFKKNARPVMPFCVLQEINLQPCGWLATFSGLTLKTDEALSFRNLDGRGEVYEEVIPGSGTLRTCVTLKRCSSFSGISLVFFETESFLGECRVCRFETSFGFFTHGALADQAGLPTTDDQYALVRMPSDFLREFDRDEVSQEMSLSGLPASMLRMFDRLTGFWPEGGRAGLGRIRAEQTIDPAAWYFKAHFFQDPVQPGSLGMQALANLLHALLLEQAHDLVWSATQPSVAEFVRIPVKPGAQSEFSRIPLRRTPLGGDHVVRPIEQGATAGIDEPQFELLALGQPVVWKYRGQVTPTSRLVLHEVELVALQRDERGVTATAEASLWVDGKRIYETTIAARIRRGAVRHAVEDAGVANQGGMLAVEGPGTLVEEEWILDPAVDRWLLDHCPTFTVPTAPIMWIVHALAKAAHSRRPNEKVVRVEHVRLFKWLICEEACKLRLSTREIACGDRETVFETTLSIVRSDGAPVASADHVASGRVVLAADYGPPPSPLAALSQARIVPSPYSAPEIFHGPALHLVRELWQGEAGASSRLDAGSGNGPVDFLHPLFLDAALHGIPHARLHEWDPTIPSDHAGFPHQIERLSIHSLPPTSGEARAEVRFAGYDATSKQAWFDVEVHSAEGLFVRFRLADHLLPKGPFAHAMLRDVRGFFAERQVVPGLRLSDELDGRTRLKLATVALVNWLPGTLQKVYAVNVREVVPLARQIAAKEHIARRLNVHPAELRVNETGEQVWLADSPGNRLRLRVSLEVGEVCVDDDPDGREQPLVPQAAAKPGLPGYLFPLAFDEWRELSPRLAEVQSQLASDCSTDALAAHCWSEYMLRSGACHALVLFAQTAGELQREISLFERTGQREWSLGQEWRTPAGSCLAAHPVGRDSEVAFVYPGIGSAYVGAARGFVELFPDAASRLEQVTGRPLAESLHAPLLYPSGSDRLLPAEFEAAERRLQDDVVALGEIGVGLGHLMTSALRDSFGITPTIAFGTSLGEVAMHASLGTWSNPAAISERIRRFDVFRNRLHGPMHAVREVWGIPDAPILDQAGPAGLWTSVIVPLSAQAVREVIAQESRVFLAQVNTPREIVLSGDPRAVARVVQRLSVVPIVLPLEFAFHCELVRSEAAALEKIYTLPIGPAPGVRFYSAAQDSVVPHDSRAVADSLVQTFCSTVDFPRLVETVYRNGARVFIELGPRRNCCDGIDAVLGLRPHVAVPLNQKGCDDSTTLLRSLARLVTHRVPFGWCPNLWCRRPACRDAAETAAPQLPQIRTPPPFDIGWLKGHEAV